MAHEIETFDDGAAAFFTARTDAWHRLGVTTRDCLTAEQVMTTARLGGWNVRTVALTAADMSADGVTSLPVPDHFATVRTHPVSGKPDVLGVVGSGYTVVQNEEHCELLNLLVDEAGAHFETAGSLRGGRETFVTMKLPQTITLAGSNGSDDIELYLAAMSSHDGTAAWRVIVTPIRIVCANTQRLALRHARATYAIRHTKTAKAKIAQARQALGIVWRYTEAFETAAQNLINQTLVLDEFQDIVNKVWPVDPTDNPGPRATTLQERRNTTLRGLFLDSDTQHTIRGTRWAGLQAITEYLDHHAPAKTDDIRAARVLTSHALAERKQIAYDLLAARS
jgi:phage/plasmid-like protein (TIGR03299 family)